MGGNHLIVGVHLSDRITDAGAVLAVFTEFGCDIKTRIGLHDADGRVCGPGGVIVLELVGGEEAAARMIARLNTIEGVEVQKMIFGHRG
jgi:hypothetical protein